MNILQLNKKTYKNFLGHKCTIGFSLLGRPILCYKIEKSTYPKIIIQASIHAREYITSYLTLKLMKDFEKNGKSGCVYFIPVMNPDGVEIALNKNPLYKANARGVDLNVNFDARWGSGEQNIRHKSTQNYIGEKAFSEPETRALRDFTINVAPNLTISYHCKGEEIYYEFFQDKIRKERDFLFAQKVSDCLGYQIKSTPNSAGGYKDWCIEKLKIPAITIEVGDDKLNHPLEKKCLRKIYRKNKNIIDVAIKHLLENKCN